MKHKIHFLNLLLWSTTLVAPIYETKKITDITKHITGPDVLVIFDIDNTLIEPDDEAASSQWFYWHFKKLRALGMRESDAIKLNTWIYKNTARTATFHPVEQETIDLINALQKTRVYPLALTARGFIDMTLKQLKTARIDLSKQEQWHDRCFIFKKFPQPAYYAPGILFANGNNKGDVLELFVKKLKYKPRKIIFVDDTLQHVESVEKMAKRMGIQYSGIHYTHLDDKVAEFNKRMESLPAHFTSVETQHTG